MIIYTTLFAAVVLLSFISCCFCCCTNESTSVTATIDEDNIVNHDSTRPTIKRLKWGILSTNAIFIATAGLLFAFIFTFDADNSWEHLGHAAAFYYPFCYGLLAFIGLYAVLYPLCSTMKEWQRLPPIYKVLGCIPLCGSLIMLTIVLVTFIASDKTQTATELTIGSDMAFNDRCYVCGVGKEVGAPDTFVVFPGSPPRTCSDLQAAGEARRISVQYCALLPSMVDVCNCQPVTPIGPLAPTTPESETPSPVTVSPVSEDPKF